MANASVLLRLIAGTPTTGLWCNACMTSGGVAVPIYQLTAAGVTTIGVGHGCLTCEGPGDVEGDE